MTERERTNKMREEQLKKLKKFYEEQGYICERILSQNSPCSLILFTEDEDKNERYIEVKVVVKKPTYEPDEDISDFKAEIERRANKQVRANLNKLNKKERIEAEKTAEQDVRNIIKSYN